MSKNADLAIAPEIAPTEPEIKTVIVLPSGGVAAELPLSGRDYWEFLQLASKGADSASQWLLLNAFTLDGQPLTIDQLEDGLDFEDVLILNAEVTKLFSPDVEAGESITLADGRSVNRRKLLGRKFFEFQRRASEKSGVLGATRWVMTQMFEIDGEPLTEAQLLESPPEGLGFRAIAQLNQILNALFTAAPALKK
ncbi:hypothetical protein [Thermoleptolyngbya sp. M55_K2018_002]|uniref:hypothetical protein n=1 Tax=Thermoleptolyngbya sp. M55_K2018_002 TaxID=2747808 RepID=UPI0019DA3959|nr:hypothetical protein [Thermoleptolyngbya sp. M55_K2018_002]HIK42155.1 hypothetical protein [Thermoleptolyngbya sp. M55_K2018_002]